MVSRYLRLAAAAVLFALPLLAAPQATLAHPSVDISASNWKFTPAKMEAHVGEATTLRVISSEGVHGIKSDELAFPTPRSSRERRPK